MITTCESDPLQTLSERWQRCRKSFTSWKLSDDEDEDEDSDSRTRWNLPSAVEEHCGNVVLGIQNLKTQNCF